MDPTRQSDGRMTCFHNPPATSAGFWFHDSPFNATLPLLLLQVSLLGFISWIMYHHALRHLRLPRHLSHILTGIIVGPTCLGRFKFFSDVLFPAKSRVQLSTVASIGNLIFLFMISVKTDIGMVRKSGKKAVAIALAATATSGFLAEGTAKLLTSSLPPELQESGLLFKIASAWSITAYINLSCVLDDLNLLNSKLGRLAMSAALIGEFIEIVVIRTIIDSIQVGRKYSTPYKAWGSFLTFLGMLLFILFVARPITMRIIRKTPEGKPLDEPHFMVVLMLALFCALFSEVIGHHGSAGVILYGLVLPSGPPLGTSLEQRLEGLIAGVHVPVFLSGPGMLNNMSIIFTNTRKCGYVQLCLLISILGKFIGAMVPAVYCKTPFLDAVSVGLMLNIKGYYEVDKLYFWQDARLADEEISSVILCNIVILMVITTALIRILYKPSMSYIAHKRRTIQYAPPNSELRILACVHSQENVSPVINIIDVLHATKSNPIYVYVLHLLESVGRADAVLVPYEKSKSSTSSETCIIVNAFKYLERTNNGCVTVQPFVSISPYATMHDDVCTMALEKKVSLVIVPFHRQMGISGKMETVNPGYQTLNINVLHYAPCSVGILIDSGLFQGPKLAIPDQMQCKIGVYFLGGPDDREALACAMRMTDDPNVSVTVIRFRLPEELRDKAKVEELDDEIVNEFMFSKANGQNAYEEKVVRDGEDTIGIIQATSSDFGLVIVGRREGEDSLLTAGLSTWNEFPELGIIGDILASTDFGCNVSTMVVQQQGSKYTKPQTQLDV